MKFRWQIPFCLSALIAASAVLLAQNPVARAAGALVITSAKTATISNTLTFTGTDGSTVAFGTGGTATYVANTRRVICDAGATSTTSATSETNLAVCTIPANTIGANGRLEVQVFLKKVGTAGAFTYSMRFSASSGDVATGFQFRSLSPGATSLSASTQQSLWNTGATNAQTSLPAAVAQGGDSNTVSATAMSTGTIDTTAVSYLNFNALVANAGDTIQYVRRIVTFIPGV